MIAASSMNGERAWYLVYTKPKQEYVAKENLERQGFSIYLPLSREVNGRRSTRDAVGPLFSRYLFICLDRERDNWSPIRSTLGVVKLVQFGGMPLAVPPELIGTIQAREQSDGYVEIAARKFLAGEKVRIVDGPMAGLEAVFLAKNSRERVTVMLNIVGNQTRISLPTELIAPAA